MSVLTMSPNATLPSHLSKLLQKKEQELVYNVTALIKNSIHSIELYYSQQLNESQNVVKSSKIENIKSNLEIENVFSSFARFNPKRPKMCKNAKLAQIMRNSKNKTQSGTEKVK